MDEKYIHWRCNNQRCEAESRVSRKDVERAIEMGKAVSLVCHNCGHVNVPESAWKPVEDGPKSWLPCIIFAGPEVGGISLGTTGDGLWKDASGNTYTRDEFMRKYYIDPEINFRWRQRGRPHARR